MKTWGYKKRRIVKITKVKLLRFIKNTKFFILTTKIKLNNLYKSNKLKCLDALDNYKLSKKKRNNTKEIVRLIKKLKSLKINPYADKEYNDLIFFPYYENIEIYTSTLELLSNYSPKEDRVSLQELTLRRYREGININNFTRANGRLKFKDSFSTFNKFILASEKFLKLYVKLDNSKSVSDYHYFLRMTQPVYFNLLTIIKSIIEIKE